MKIVITGFDPKTHRISYTQQSLVKGSITGTYSSSRAVEKDIASSNLASLGEHVDTEDGRTWAEESILLGLLYKQYFKGDWNELVGKDGKYTPAAKPVEIPTADDLAYIEENAKPAGTPTWKAQGDANDYCLLDDRGHWVAAIRLNGEMSTAAQEEWLDRYFKRG